MFESSSSRLRAGALLSCLTLVTLSVVRGEPGSESRSGTCVVVPHEAGDTAGTRRQRKHPVGSTRFDIYETSALELDVHCARGPFPELRVQLSLPNGDVYETLEAIPETTPSRRGRAPLATARLAILGSYITQYGLTGEWSARACWREGDRERCGPRRRFSLER